MIRKASNADLDAIAGIYAHVHAQEAVRAHTGWLPGVYPVKATAEAALMRDDLFVCEEDGSICAAAVINQIQVDVYADCAWMYPASEREVMVLHTLVVEPSKAGKGIGTAFVRYYEAYARSQGCTVLRMDTNAKNTPARKLYAGLGYREADIVPCVFNNIPDVHLVLLEKKL